MAKIECIRIRGARQNCLKNLTVEFPYRKLTVVTGLSGSGKSSLVFDTLYAEGQRRYIESLSTYTRQFLDKMPKPDVDGVDAIPPAIALEQRNTVMNSRSTVGTQTEIVDYLRVLYARIGKSQCPDCGIEVQPSRTDTILEDASWLVGRKAAIAAPITTLEKKSPKLETYFQVLREQGLRRLLWIKPRKNFDVIDLEDPGELDTKAFWSSARVGRVHVMIDRLKLEQAPTDTDRARINDSIEQTLRIGGGKLLFFDLDSGESKTFDTRFVCPKCERELKTPEPSLFSFNNPVGACAGCSGFGYTLDLDEALVVPDPTKTLKNGAIDPLSKPSLDSWQTAMFRLAEKKGISIGKRYSDLTPTEKKILWDDDPKEKGFPGILGCFRELARKKYKLHVRVFIRRYQTQTKCKQCNGTRLNREALSVTIGGRSLGEALAMPVSAFSRWIGELPISELEAKVAHEVLSQVRRRVELLKTVGVGYLTLDRLAKTLSGGEFQRINLATQLGGGLCGTLYVLDEPSIGLHSADTDQLTRVLEGLRDQGNTVVVVEHDLSVMKKADWIIELGPGAGRRGGELVAQGTPEQVKANPLSLTGKYLSGATRLLRPRPWRAIPKRWLKLTGCRENNLHGINIEIPLERFVVVTGVSGSGKSTLIHQTLYPALARLLAKNPAEAGVAQPGRFDRIYGAEQLSSVILLDQKPIGKSARSNAATTLKIWEEVRRIYANQSLSLRRGYTPQHFSFNVDGGRCPVCKGEGEVTIDMHFLAEIKLPCEECLGKRFKNDVLDVTYRGKNVHELLQTTIDDSFDHFRDNPIIARKLGILRDVGLGYLRLGQASHTLSGGESQRLKIARVLEEGNPTGQRLLYLFDEPTTGLHAEDIRKLMDVIHDLVEARHTVVLVEHHLDLIAQADWVIDLGPGGGEAGGHVVAQGPPWRVGETTGSLTGEFLKSGAYPFPERERDLPIDL